eukprot:SAG31_NODE_2801_length_5073_cov_12.272618_2_plen_79_part_00
MISNNSSDVPVLECGTTQVMLYSGGNDGAPRPTGVTYTWYQIGAAFSADGENFTKLSAAESPYAGRNVPYSGSVEVCS